MISPPPRRHAGHLTALRAWTCKQAMSAWSVNTRLALSRHSRDARVYGHPTTAMHDIEYISHVEYTPQTPRTRESNKYHCYYYCCSPFRAETKRFQFLGFCNFHFFGSISLTVDQLMFDAPQSCRRNLAQSTN